MHGIEGLLEISAILVCGAFVFATLFARFGLPSIPAYILAGALLGPHTFGLIADGDHCAADFLQKCAGYEPKAT